MGNCDERDYLDVFDDDFEKFMYSVNTKTLIRDLLIDIYNEIPNINKENYISYQEILASTKFTSLAVSFHSLKIYLI